jgi:hypothetical protein
MQFTLLALKGIVTHPQFRTWAENWIGNTDRSVAANQQIRKELESEHQASEDLELLAAWGASSSDDLKTVHNMEEQTQRALHVLRAAELAEGGVSNADAVAAELAMALKDIVQEANKHDLQTLAERVLGADPVQETDQEDDAVTG